MSIDVSTMAAPEPAPPSPAPTRAARRAPQGRTTTKNHGADDGFAELVGRLSKNEHGASEPRATEDAGPPSTERAKTPRAQTTNTDQPAGPAAEVAAARPAVILPTAVAVAPAVPTELDTVVQSDQDDTAEVPTAEVPTADAPDAVTNGSEHARTQAAPTDRTSATRLTRSAPLPVALEPDTAKPEPADADIRPTTDLPENVPQASTPPTMAATDQATDQPRGGAPGADARGAVTAERRAEHVVDRPRPMEDNQGARQERNPAPPAMQGEVGTKSVQTPERVTPHEPATVIPRPPLRSTSSAPRRAEPAAAASEKTLSPDELVVTDDTRPPVGRTEAPAQADVEPGRSAVPTPVRANAAAVAAGAREATGTFRAPDADASSQASRGLAEHARAEDPAGRGTTTEPTRIVVPAAAAGAEFPDAGLLSNATTPSAGRGPDAAGNATLPAARAADVPKEVLPQIVKAMQLQWRAGVGEARIQLQPEHLGDVTISLRVQDGVVTASVRAENPAVQTWIEGRQQELRSGLAQQGLRLDQFEVTVSPDSRRQPQSEQHRSRRHVRPPKAVAGARFEIDV